LQAHFIFSKTQNTNAIKNKKNLQSQRTGKQICITKKPMWKLAAYNSMQAIAAGLALIWKFVFLL
jgi:hypothetical protein